MLLSKFQGVNSAVSLSNAYAQRFVVGCIEVYEVRLQKKTFFSQCGTKGTSLDYRVYCPFLSP
eukprot:2593562-Rhodomonas_salina.2